MGKVRWAGWTMAVATALVISGVQMGRADIASDKPAAIVIYPKIQVDTRQTNSQETINTIVRLTNTNQTSPVNAHCFYVNANSHCSGGLNDGEVCTDNPTVCTGLSFCVPGWQEVDFHIRLSPGQPIEWDAEDGLSQARVCANSMSGRPHPCRVNADCPGSFCTEGLPLPTGVCVQRPSQTCFSDMDCQPFPGGACTQSNVGTDIPPVAEDPFIGELKCIEIDDNGAPVANNDLKGEALLEEIETSPPDFDVASYNAIGVQACNPSVTAGCVAPGTTAPNELVLGGSAPEYNGCPNYLILNHFFYDAENPVPGTNADVETRLTLVPCSEDFLRQIPGTAVVQYLVYNEFEQRFSTSKPVECYQDIELCNIDTTDCSRSIFNVAVAGTLTGQTRINPLSVALPLPSGQLGVPSGLLGVAVEEHIANGSGVDVDRSAAFNLHMAGARTTSDVITTVP